MIDPSPADQNRTLRLMQLDIRHLVVFDTIYTTGNLSMTARRLGLAQPTVSNMLGRMRDVFEDKLFLRRASGMTPTVRAEGIIDGVRRVLQECETLGQTPVTFNPATATRDFKLHLVDIFETLVVPDLVKDFARYPDISYKMLVTPKIPIVQALESGEADLAVGIAPPNNQNLRWEAIMPIELVAIARKDHPGIHGPLTAEQFGRLGHVSLDFAHGALANTATFRPSYRIERNDVVRVTRPGSVLEIVARSDLVGLAHPLQLKMSPFRDQLQLIDVPLPTFNQYFQMTWHQRNTADPDLIWLMNRIREILRPHGPRNAQIREHLVKKA